MTPTFDSFEAAQAQVATQAEAMVVCGALLPSGEPRYFLAPADADTDQVRGKAFEVRTGRKMTGYESFLLEQAQALRDSSVTA